MKKPFETDKTIHTIELLGVIGKLKSNNIENQVYFVLTYSPLESDGLYEEIIESIILDAKKYCKENNLKLVSY